MLEEETITIKGTRGRNIPRGLVDYKVAQALARLAGFGDNSRVFAQPTDTSSFRTILVFRPEDTAEVYGCSELDLLDGIDPEILLDQLVKRGRGGKLISTGQFSLRYNPETVTHQHVEVLTREMQTAYPDDSLRGKGERALEGMLNFLDRKLPEDNIGAQTIWMFPPRP